MIKKVSQKKEIKKPKPKNQKKEIAQIEKPKKIDVKKKVQEEDTSNKMDKTVDIFDFSEDGYRAWYKELSPEAKKAIGDTPVVLPPKYIVEAIKTNSKTGLEMIFLPEYKDLVGFGKPTRLRLVSLAIREPYACTRLTYMINTMKEYQETDPDMFKKLTLIAEDMNDASKSILGKRIARSIYRKNSIEMISSTLGTITIARPAPKPENDGQSQGESTPQSTPQQDTSTPSVE